MSRAPGAVAAGPRQECGVTMTEHLPMPSARTPEQYMYQTNRFGMFLPQRADRVQVTVLDDAFEVLDDNAAHLALDNVFTGPTNTFASRVLAGQLAMTAAAVPSSTPPFVIGTTGQGADFAYYDYATVVPP